MPEDLHLAERDSLNAMFDELSHGTRRQILRALVHHDPRTEAEFTVEDCGIDGRSTASINAGLHHIHLPKLADAGVIDWDPQTESIARGPRFGEIESLLERLDDHHDTLPKGGSGPTGNG